jgi:cytochrome c
MSGYATRGRVVLAAVLAVSVFGALPAAAADAVHGKSVFSSQCGVCHSAAKDGSAIIGPPLFGVVGRRAGSVAGFAYSPAMKSAALTWTNDTLHTFLTAPRKMVDGTKMTFMGVKNPDQLDDLVAYLDTLK